jgi:hypothetical protein
LLRDRRTTLDGVAAFSTRSSSSAGSCGTRHAELLIDATAMRRTASATEFVDTDYAGAWSADCRKTC